MDAEKFFTPSFLRAIKENTEESFRSIMTEPCKGIYTFEMLQPRFCEMLVSEVYISLLCFHAYIILSDLYQCMFLSSSIYLGGSF